MAVSVSGQDILKDSLYIRTFGVSEYRASLYNYSVTEDENGIFYFANESGVLEYDGSTWKFHSLPDFSLVVTVAAAPDGRIYIGGLNEFGYLSRHDEGQLTYTSLRGLVDPKKELDEIWQIVFHNGQVLFQTYWGLIKYNGETAQLLPIENSWFLPLDNEMFIHSWNKGLGRLEDDTVIYVNGELIFDNEGQEENAFKTLKWIGSEKLLFTEFSGILLLDTITFKSRLWEISSHDELVSDGIYNALHWNDSLYLISTVTNGLKWINLRGEVVKRLTKKDGIDAEVYGNLYQDTKGNIWLPAEGIHHIIWPNQQKLEDFRTLIRSIVIDDSVFVIDNSEGYFESEFPAPLTSATFTFSSPGFDKTDLQYSYMLEGFEQDWSNWTDNINATYTNLEGGEYIFRVKSRIVGGKESKPASLEFCVPILWYQTGWAYAFSSFFLWLLLVAAFKYRTKRLTSQNRILEETIQDRIKEVRLANEELQNKNTELDNFVHRVSHDLIAPLRSIKGLVSITRTEESEQGRNECFDLIDASVNKQENFIKSILEHSVNFNQNVNSEQIYLKKIYDEIIAELTYFEESQSIDFICDFKENFVFQSDPDRVKIVLSNLVNNAMKYHNLDQDNPSIRLTATKESGTVTLEIIDNGRGIEEEKLPDIFNMFYRASYDADGTGLGLYIVRDAMKKMNGTISVSSEINKGSTFTLIFNS